ncbi:MAG: Maf family protein [bacterium]
MRVILASGSPRRRELLAALIDDFEVVVSGVDEPWEADPIANAEHLAAAKASDVFASHPGCVVIGADTIVFDDDRSYGKPDDEAHAVAMWRALRGRSHRVATGLAVVSAEHGADVASVVAEVELTSLSDAAVVEYAQSGRPMDKAGAYAIQDEDVPTVAALSGCFCSVMGLPLWNLKASLESAGVLCRAPSLAYKRCATCPEAPDR